MFTQVRARTRKSTIQCSHNLNPITKHKFYTYKVSGHIEYFQDPWWKIHSLFFQRNWKMLSHKESGPRPQNEQMISTRRSGPTGHHQGSPLTHGHCRHTPREANGREERSQMTSAKEREREHKKGS